MRAFRTFCVIVAGLLFLFSPVAAQDDSYILHTVIKGQGLYSISRMYGVTEADIIALNPGSDQVIRAGEQLRIPRKTAADAAKAQASPVAGKKADGYIHHIVQPGETVYRLTVMYGVSGEEIYEANPVLRTETLKAGQEVLIPAKQKAEAASETDQVDGQQKSYRTKGAYGESTDTDDDRQGTSFWDRLFGKGKVKNAVAADSLASPMPCRLEHVVQRKETIFSLARQYGISQEELIAANPSIADGKLKRGQVLCIPESRTAQPADADAEPVVTTTDEHVVPQKDETEQRDDVNAIHAALILPFMLNDGTATPGADKAKMIEYYEGFLLAVDTLRQQGVSIELHVYDSGDKKASIKPILESEEMARMDIIFGPMHQGHIDEATAFAREHDIPLVLPFARSVSDIASLPSVWQVNASQSVVEDEAITGFFRLFAEPNVLFFKTRANEEPFAARLQKELAARNLEYSVFNADTTSNVSSFMAACSTDRDNVLVLTSSDNASLSSMIPVFQLMQRDTTAVAPIHLFGYPQYQTYSSNRLSLFHELDTWFYSTFYTNSSFPDAADINRKFYRNFSREIGNRYPRYALLGYDTALWFFNMFTGYSTSPVQSGFRFERVGEGGGHVNHKLFFIHMATDGTITKSDLDR